MPKTTTKSLQTATVENKTAKAKTTRGKAQGSEKIEGGEQMYSIEVITEMIKKLEQEKAEIIKRENEKAKQKEMKKTPTKREKMMNILKLMYPAYDEKTHKNTMNKIEKLVLKTKKENTEPTTDQHFIVLDQNRQEQKLRYGAKSFFNKFKYHYFGKDTSTTDIEVKEFIVKHSFKDGTFYSEANGYTFAILNERNEYKKVKAQYQELMKAKNEALTKKVQQGK